MVAPTASNSPTCGKPSAEGTERQWFTPPEVARERGIRVTKVLAWIKSGELEAVNHASNLCGPPRWRVSREALAGFDAARSNRGGLEQSLGGPPPATRRRRPQPDIEEFF